MTNLKQQQQQTENPTTDFLQDSNYVIIDDSNHAASCFDGENAEKIISEKLNKLSLEERNRAMYELHGITDEQQEALEINEKKLKEMTKIAEHADETEAAAYFLALAMDQEYVERIKLLCLQADYHDSQKAAARMLAFFNFKLGLFGASSIARDITFDDFKEEDKVAIREGCMQLLPERDRAGRAVLLLISGSKAYDISLETWVRFSSYYCSYVL